MIFVILIFASILRLINLKQSLWLDEAVQAITAQKSFGYIFQEISGDFHPPLYHFLMHFWVRIFGSSEVILRLPSVLFGVGTVYTVYLIAKKVFPQVRCSLFFIHCSLPDLAALLMATAPFHIYYSQEARMYSLTCFLAVLSMFYFLKIFSEGIPGQRPTSSKFKVQSAKLQFKNLASRNFCEIQKFGYLWYFLATLCLIYSDYYGFFVLLAQGAYLLIKKRYKFLILSSFFLILAYFPWLPMLITQIKTGISATRSLPGWSNLVNVSFWKAIPLTLIKFTIGRITIFDKRVYAVVILGVLGGLGVLAVRSIRLIKEDWVKIVALWFIIPIVITWAVSLIVPNYRPFRLLLVLPAFYLLISTAILNIKSKGFQKLVIVVVLTINLVSLGVYYFNPYFHREDWRGVVKYVEEQKNAVAVLPSETSNWPIRYYDPDNKVNLISIGKGANTVDGEQLSAISDRLSVTREKEVYYVRYLVPLFDPGEKILKELERSNYSKIKEVSFNQIEVWKFKRSDQ